MYSDEMGILEILAAHLCRARVLYGVSQREMAEHIGVSPALISRIEHGRERPSERVLKAYADRFRMELDELNRLAGRVSSDVREHLLATPGAVDRVRELVVAETKSG